MRAIATLEIDKKLQTAELQHSDLNDLQNSLDAYLDKQLAFSELRTQWIKTLADNPGMRNSAVRLLYQQPSNRYLSEGRALTLKRIVETAIHDDADDWTVILDEEDESVIPDDAAPEQRPTSVERVVKSHTLSPFAKTRAKQPTNTARKTPVPGDILNDRFVLEEQLGRGGVGIVFKARDQLRERTNAGPAEVALKVLSEEYRDSPEMIRSMQRETLRAQSLSHPNIIRVHDLHQDDENWFLTMELLDGELLKTLLSRSQPSAVPTELALRIISGLCLGLAHAHAKGLVHADIKPGNVFLTAGGDPKIFDFGLAQATVPDSSANNAGSRPASKAMQAVTPAYSSCNRLEGGAPGFSDDVYSLSCVIYELLAGRHPYDRKSAVVVRELNLQPARIPGLTDLQWRTLATGLRPAREDRSTEVFDLQEAFTRHTLTTGPSAPTVKTVVEKRRRAGSAVSGITGLLVGAGIMAGIAVLGIQVVPSKFVDQARESTVVQTMQSTLGVEQSESSLRAAPILQELPDPTTEESIVIADSSPPSINESETLQTDAVESEPEIALIDEATSDTQASAVAATETIEPSFVPALPTPGFRLGAAEYVVQENSIALAVQIDRQGDLSNPANVEWTTYAGSAESQLDYAGFFRSQVEFAPGEASKTIFIPIVSDNDAESNESFRISLSRPAGDMVLAQPYSATVVIVDDDA